MAPLPSLGAAEYDELVWGYFRAQRFAGVGVGLCLGLGFELRLGLGLGLGLGIAPRTSLSLVTSPRRLLF